MVSVLSSISISQNDIVSIYSWQLCPQILVALQEMFWGTVNMLLIYYFPLEGVRQGTVQTDMSEPNHKMQSKL